MQGYVYLCKTDDGFKVKTKSCSNIILMAKSQNPKDDKLRIIRVFKSKYKFNNNHFQGSSEEMSLDILKVILRNHIALNVYQRFIKEVVVKGTLNIFEDFESFINHKMCEEETKLFVNEMLDMHVIKQYDSDFSLNSVDSIVDLNIFLQ